MSVSEQTEIVMPSNPVDQQALTQILRHITDSMTRIDGEREAIKEFVAEASEKYELPKNLISKFAKIMHKENMQSVKIEAENLETMYETLVNKGKE